MFDEIQHSPQISSFTKTLLVRCVQNLLLIPIKPRQALTNSCSYALHENVNGEALLLLTDSENNLE